MTTHPILGQLAPVESLARAMLEAINASGGCSISAELAGINARALQLPAFGQWLPIDSAPVDVDVLLWNDATEEISIGYKPEGAPDDGVIVNFTASYADSWHPLPSTPPAQAAAKDSP